MNKKSPFFRFSRMMAVLIAYSSVTQAGTIYLYVENNTDTVLSAKPYNQKVPLTTIKPHTTQDVAYIDGTPSSSMSFKDNKVVELTLPKIKEKLYLKAGSTSKTEKSIFDTTTVRAGLNWDISLNPSILEVGHAGDVPNEQRVFTVKQNQNCSGPCLFYKITAKKQDYLIRAPDIYFAVEEVRTK